MSRNTVKKYVRELEYKALIITEPTKYESQSGQVRNGNLIYTILLSSQQSMLIMEGKQ